MKKRCQTSQTPKSGQKKEILGHLVDSGINNLQRFTEIQFSKQPYELRPYNQDGLVKVNNYQQDKTNNILELMVSINNRIINVIKIQTEETLKYQIVTHENERIDLKFLIEDYVKHFEHHTKQIIE